MEPATKIVDLVERQEARRKHACYTALREGHLVILRSFHLDQWKGSKLDARWPGPYILSDPAKHGKSGRLRHLNTAQLIRVKKGSLREPVHLTDLKI